MKLPGLNSQLIVPTEWVGRQALHDSLYNFFRELLVSYGVASRLDDFTPAIDSLVQCDQIDFAHLDSRLQELVIRKIHGDGALRRELLSRNAWIEEALRPDEADAEVIRHNTEVIEEDFSIEGTGRNLMRLYQQILDRPTDREVSPLANTAAVLDAFLDPNYLYPIRFEP